MGAGLSEAQGRAPVLRARQRVPPNRSKRLWLRLTKYYVVYIMLSVNLGSFVSNTSQGVLDGFRLFYEELAFSPRPLRKIRRSRPAKD
jgi:hypothetical protein